MFPFPYHFGAACMQHGADSKVIRFAERVGKASWATTACMQWHVELWPLCRAHLAFLGCPCDVCGEIDFAEGIFLFLGLRSGGKKKTVQENSTVRNVSCKKIISLCLVVLVFYLLLFSLLPGLLYRGSAFQNVQIRCLLRSEKYRFRFSFAFLFSVFF